jgi:hypothetical protein
MKTENNKNHAVRLTKLSSGAFQGHFGGCPYCGFSEGPHHVGRVQWLVCPEHRVRWWIGENLFRSWRSETPVEWERTRRWLNDFRIVDPAYGEDSNPVEEAESDGR